MKIIMTSDEMHDLKSMSSVLVTRKKYTYKYIQKLDNASVHGIQAVVDGDVKALVRYEGKKDLHYRFVLWTERIYDICPTCGEKYNHRWA